MAPIFALLLTTAHAHILGNAHWCMSNSSIHFECFYDSKESCDRMMKSRGVAKSFGGGTPLDGWSCVDFPYEFSLKPESRLPEKPPAPAKNP